MNYVDAVNKNFEVTTTEAVQEYLFQNATEKIVDSSAANEIHFVTGNARYPLGTTKHSRKEAKAATSSSSRMSKDKNIHGNFQSYYRHRLNKGLPNEIQDPRIPLMRKEWFEGKDVLDIGCNTGLVTLTLVKKFKPRSIRGIDIDTNLIKIAKKTSKRGEYLDLLATSDVSFVQQNYVLESDEELQFVQPQYDTIIALSVTMRIHKSEGDDGLRRFFRRGFLELRPGGRMILEPQSIAQYYNRLRALNGEQIQFKPDQFTKYILEEVGYDSVEELGFPIQTKKLYQRPLYMFQKSM